MTMAIFDICVVVLLVAVSTTTTNAESVCNDFLENDANSPSGMREVKIQRGGKILVYCEMGLNGGGYTFLTQESLTMITGDELATWFTNKTTFLFRVRKTDGTQPYASFAPLPQFSNHPFKLGLSENTDYGNPFNAKPELLGNLFLYFGFIPAAVASANSVGGIMINGKSKTYQKCGGSPDSYIALFPNFKELQPSTEQHQHPFCDEVFGNLWPNPSQRIMPPEMFFFGEAHWGGCGCYKQTNQIPGITGFNIGFK